MDKSPISDAIRAAGGPVKLAAILGVGPSVVTNWRARGNVPEAYCPAIESATGVLCGRLRPDVAWTRDTAGRVTGYHIPIRGAQ